MNRNQFLVLLGVLVVLVAAGAGVMWWQSGEWRSTDARVGQRVIPGLVISNVGSIRVQDAGSSATVEVKDGVWRVKERADYPGNLDRIGELLTKLADLKIAQVEPLADSQRARLQLVDPAKAAKAGETKSGKPAENKDAATALELKDKSGKPIARLLLGKKVVRQSAITAPTKGVPDASGRYVAPGEPGVVAVVSDPLSQVEAKPELWLARDLVRVHGARQMTSVGPEGRVRWSVSRESESSDWKSNTPGDKLDNNKIQDLVSVLIYVALADVAPDAAQAGFERGPTLKIDTFNNYHYALTFGEQEGDLRYLKIALEGDPPKTRTPEKGESPEDKDKKDKQYAEDYKGMLGQIEREKKLEGWTFLVKDSDVQALLRDRAQLLPEKKDEKKDDRKK